MKPPCEQCIAYAACKHKETLECDRLYEWLKDNFRHGYRYATDNHLFTLIITNQISYEYFPDVMKIFIGKPINANSKKIVFLFKLQITNTYSKLEWK